MSECSSCSWHPEETGPEEWPGLSKALTEPGLYAMESSEDGVKWQTRRVFHWTLGQNTVPVPTPLVGPLWRVRVVRLDGDAHEVA